MFAGKIAISAALIAYLLVEVDPREIASRAGEADAFLLVAALAVIGLLPPLVGVRWYFVMRSIGPRFPLRVSVPVSYIGLLFGQVLPASVGSDAVRGWYAYRQGVGLREAVGSLVIDRIYGVLALALLILVTAPVVLRIATPEVAYSALIAATVIVAAVLAILLLTRMPRGLIAWPKALATLFDTFRMAKTSFWSANAAAALAMSLAIHLSNIFGGLLIAFSLGVRIGFGECVAVVAIATLLTNLPVSFNGWGVREGAMVVGMGYLGVGPGDALTISILQGIGLAVSVIPGIPLWLISRSRKDDDGTEIRDPAAG